jgi:hypothetical protein
MRNGERLAGDTRIISDYAAQMTEAFDELDSKNEEMLAEALEKQAGQSSHARL